MNQIKLSDFTGGINEVISPDDFKSNQWAVLNGVIPRNADSFESQWPIQSIGSIGETWQEPTYSLVSYSSVSNVATLTTSTSNFYHVGDKITVSGVSALNGQYTITEVVDSKSFKITVAGLGTVSLTTVTNANVVMYSTAVDTANISGVFPLQSAEGDYLVATKSDGSIWWCKTPADDAVYSVANAVIWRRLVVARNQGYNNATSYSAQPDIEIERNPDYRFISEIPFEVYNYIKSQPSTATAGDFSKDVIVDTVAYDDNGEPISGDLVPSPRSSVPGVLLHSRRFYDTVDGVRKLTRTVDKEAGYSKRTQTAVIAYVDPYLQKVQAVTFPNVRRWPTYITAGTGYNSTSSPIVPTVIMSNLTQSGVSPTAERPFIAKYPFPDTASVTNGGASAYPKPENTFHPYTWLDKNKVLHPGTGFIPRGNVGTMWDGHLIIGDIEWRSEGSATYSQDDKLKPLANHAALGNSNAPFGLRDGNTEPHRGYFYYSENDIDKFDPISVEPVSGTNARITGMHQLNNKLIVVTSGGSESDGIFSYSGNLSQLHPYTPNVVSNPLSVRKQIIRGGVGTADYVDSEVRGHLNQTCLWSEAGAVVFVDRLGGIFYSSGQTADRLDRMGPRQPKGSTYYDHVAAAGKHLLVWRDDRLLCNTIITTNSGTQSSVWTSLVLPQFEMVSRLNASKPSGSTADEYGFALHRSLRSMYGSNNNFYAVLEVAGFDMVGGTLVDNGEVYTQVVRFAINGPRAEKLRVNNQVQVGSVGTATTGAIDENIRFNWHRVGISFTTETEAFVSKPAIYNKSILKQYENGILQQGGFNWLYNDDSKYIEDSTLVGYQAGTHSLVSAAAIGQSNLISVLYTFTGDIKLDSVSLWHTGGIKERNNNS